MPDYSVLWAMLEVKFYLMALAFILALVWWPQSGGQSPW